MWGVCVTPKLAVSAGILGTVAGVQLLAVFQSLLIGSRRQVALPAKAEVRSQEKKKAENRKTFISRPQQKSAVTSSQSNSN
jgi:hypothetical protein